MSAAMMQMILASHTPTWTQMAASGLNADDAGSWSTQNLRQVIASAQLSFVGATSVRVTLAASAANSNVFSSAYIGHAAATGDAYDFESTPTQLLFSGSAGATISAGGVTVSDTCTFTVQAGKNLIVSVKLVSGSNLKSVATSTGWSIYYSAAGAAATVDATSYTGPYTKAAMLVSKIEGLQ